MKSLSGKQQKNMNIIRKIVSVTAILLLVFICIITYKVLTIPVRTTKDYSIMYVDKNDIIDSETMINPPEKYSLLLKIDLKVRKKVAKYMKKNNFKLKTGNQEFITNDPTFKELINDFVFESIN